MKPDPLTPGQDVRPWPTMPAWLMERAVLEALGRTYHELRDPEYDRGPATVLVTEMGEDGERRTVAVIPVAVLLENAIVALWDRLGAIIEEEI